MKNSVILPSALQICLDDLGWHLGNDSRCMGKPSRTGMPRKHVPEDYVIVNEIGKAIGQKILCPICLAEWDKDNILRGEIGTTFDPHNWNRAAQIDYELTSKSFDVAESSDFIEYSLHGNLHGNYSADGKQITEMEYFEYKNNDKLLSTQSEEEILHRFELFFKIYESWGFKKKIRSFVAPNGIPEHLTNDDLLPLASALKKNGISYWTSRWKKTISDTVFYDGIVYMEKHVKFGVPWNAYDYDPAFMKDFAAEGDEELGDVLGIHWPNFLKFNYQNNMQTLEPWTNYFKKQSEIFGLMISKDIEFSTRQHIYRKFSTLSFEDDKIIIDVSNAKEQPTDCLNNEFYISIKNNYTPCSIVGGHIELYETHNNFKIYKTTHTNTKIEITLK